MFPESRGVTWKTEQLSGPEQSRQDSTNCGIFVAYFLCHRHAGIDLIGKENPIVYRSFLFRVLKKGIEMCQQGRVDLLSI